MRDGILICEGKSNEDWNCSVPYGTGIKLSSIVDRLKPVLNIKATKS